MFGGVFRCIRSFSKYIYKTRQYIGIVNAKSNLEIALLRLGIFPQHFL